MVAVFFFSASSLSASKKGGDAQCFFFFLSRLHHRGDYDNPYLTDQARPVPGGASREVGQRLGQLWLTSPDAGMLAMGL